MQPPRRFRPPTLRDQFRQPLDRGRRPALWAALLSLVVPGLGQLYAGAWRVGAALLALNIAITLAARVLITIAPPILPALAAAGFLLLASLALQLAAAADAARRVRRDPAAPRPPWFRSTWFAAPVLLAIGFGLQAALPFRWRAFTIPSSSMAPTLMPGDDLLADARPGYIPARGDVIVFARAPDDDYVKRIIGLPGDHVALMAGIIIINDSPAPQTEGADAIIAEDMSFGIKARRITETLPGAAPHPIYRIPGAGLREDVDEITVPPGRLFVLGDNRDNSVDSRFPQIGFVAIDSIIGPARTLYWSRERSRILTNIP